VLDILIYVAVNMMTFAIAISQ